MAEIIQKGIAQVGVVTKQVGVGLAQQGGEPARVCSGRIRPARKIAANTART